MMDMVILTSQSNRTLGLFGADANLAQSRSDVRVIGVGDRLAAVCLRVGIASVAGREDVVCGKGSRRDGEKSRG